jgi:hypothetical protein
MGEVFLTSEESQKGPAFLCDVIADGATQHGISRLKRIQHGALGYFALDLNGDFSANLRKVAQVKWKYNANCVGTHCFLPSGGGEHSGQHLPIGAVDVQDLSVAEIRDVVVHRRFGVAQTTKVAYWLSALPDCLFDGLHFDGQYRRQVVHNRIPIVTGIG